MIAGKQSEHAEEIIIMLRTYFQRDAIATIGLILAAVATIGLFALECLLWGPVTAHRAQHLAVAKDVFLPAILAAIVFMLRLQGPKARRRMRRPVWFIQQSDLPSDPARIKAVTPQGKLTAGALLACFALCAYAMFHSPRLFGDSLDVMFVGAVSMEFVTKRESQTHVELIPSGSALENNP